MSVDKQRADTIRRLGDLKRAFAGVEHPGVTAAFDLAEVALLEAITGSDNRLTARDITLRMFRAVMGAGFMIVHKDELHNAMLACAQVGKIVNVPGLTCADHVPMEGADG